MNLARLFSVFFIAMGLAGVSVALGFIYMDFVKREGAWVEMGFASKDMTPSERDAILDAWRDPGRGWGAFGAGTLGVALLGAGIAIGVFELPPFTRNSADRSSQ